MNQPRETIWHGQPAWTLESARLRAITVPGMGAKIVSIYDKTGHHEWLRGPAGDRREPCSYRPFQPVCYGASFVDQDMSGWDEMFPTINACEYPGEGPYAGVSLPDHGEVWALPWEIVQAGGEALTLRVCGRALPYQLTRTMSLADAQSLRLDYTVVNTGDAPLAGLWAAHPQFAVTAATEIRLPPTVEKVIAVGPPSGRIEIGAHLDWPLAITSDTPDEQRIRLDRVSSAAVKRSRKVYVLPDQRVSWAMLVETGSSHWLRMDWDSAQVPYLGIWADEGHYNPAPTIALEPSTGFYDGLALAWDNRRVPILPPGEKSEWSLTVSVGRN